MYVNRGFRNELNQARKKKRLGQVDVCVLVQEETGASISQSQFSLIEKGYRDPTRPIAKALIKLFNLDKNYFGDLNELEER